MEHISDDDLERYCLRGITGEAELALVEEHILVCSECVNRAVETQAYVEVIRAGIVRGGFSRA